MPLVKSRTRFAIALLAAGFLTLIVIIITTFWLGRRAQQYASDVTQISELRVSAVELRIALLTGESGQRGFLFSNNEIYLAPFDSAKAAARREADELRRKVEQYPQLQGLVTELGTLVDAKIKEMEETVALKLAGKDQEALDLFLSNRGKALMDQAILFLTGLIEASDTLLIDGVREQVGNANWLRWTSIAGGLVIVLVVAGAINAFRQTMREIAGARDEVRALNSTLERRVEERTSALRKALDRSELLLAEVNHRVANSLAMVGSLVRLQVRATTEPSVKDALIETQARIAAVGAVHKRLYESGDVGLVALDEYLSGLLEGLATAMRAEGRKGSLVWQLEQAKLGTDASINVGIVVAELVTNAYKYAYPEGSGEIRVRMQQVPASRIEIVVEDDGIGRGAGPARGTGLGTRIVASMAANLGTEVQYFDRKPGTTASLTLPAYQA